MVSMFCERSNAAWRMLWQGALLLFVVGICQPKQTLAQSFQQWQGPDANHPINNANIPNNVGIGITTPGATLHVLAITNPGIFLDANGPIAPQLRFRRSNGASSNQPANAGDVLGNISFTGFSTSAFAASGSSKIVATASETWNDNAQGSQLGFYTTPTGSPAGGGVLHMTIDPFGRVGIGTSVPTYPLDVVAGPVQNVVMRLWGQQGSISDNVQLRFAGQKDGEMWAIGSDVAAGGSTKDFEFYDLTAGATRLAINSSGNVGIGTTNPTSLLHVAGNITGVTGSLSGTLTVTGVASQCLGLSNVSICAPNGTIAGNNVVANYQDVAEWVPASMKMPAGTVVVIDAQVNNHVSPSSTPYDTRVAGVVSANPGVILGQRGEDKVMVATTGRVKVRVDATRAPIRVGDLLVTSDKEGVAMRSMPVNLGGTPIHRPGTLIGKALEPLASGTGEILVLLSLQ